MVFWESPPGLAAESCVRRDFAAIWQAAEKVVYSTRLRAVGSARTRIERDFDPAAVRRMKASASGDIAVGGAALAMHAFAAGLVDECQLFLAPVIVGAGKHALPTGDLRVGLELLEQRRFTNGTVYLRYRTRG